MSNKQHKAILVADYRCISYFVLTVVLLAGATHLYQIHWQGTQQLHTLLELAATLVAFFVGVMALAMYRADTRQTGLLILSYGFFGTAFLDGYHCIATTTAFAQKFPSSLESLVPWSWHASRTFLSIFVCLAFWITVQRRFTRQQITRIISRSAVVLAIGCFVFFSFFQLPPAYYSGELAGRPQEFIPAVMFAIALIGMIKSGRWKQGALEHWYVMSLIISVGTQAIFMSQSHAIFDCMFDLAHVLKIVSYVFVGTGLTIGMTQLFRGADELRLMSLAVQNTDRGVAILDQRAEIEFANDGFQRLTGYSLIDAKGGKIGDLLYGSATNKVVARRLDDLLSGRKKGDVEIECHSCDGRVFWAIIEVSPVAGPDRNICNYIVFIKDTTAQRKAESEKKRLHDEFLMLSRQAGMAEIATGTLHNVGNVLTSVNTSVNVLQRDKESHPIVTLQKVSSVIQAEKHQLQEFFASERGSRFPDLLTELTRTFATCQQQEEDELSQLASHIDHIKHIIAMQQSYAKQGGTAEVVNLKELVQQALKMYETSLIRHGIHLDVQLADDVKLPTEKHMVLQVIVNLITNAKNAIVEYPERSKSELSLTLTQGDQHAELAITDTGIGIPAENMSRLFEHGFTTRKQGHGFGLHSCQLAIKDLGGELTVFSEGAGHGATFTIRLPLATQSVNIADNTTDDMATVIERPVEKSRINHRHPTVSKPAGTSVS